MSAFFPWPMKRHGGPGLPPGGGGPGLSTRFGSAPADLSAWIRSYWPQAAWVGAAEVSYLESGWRPGAIDDTRPLAGGLCNKPIVLHGGALHALSEFSIGYFQLNLCAHTSITLAQALDGQYNTQWAAGLYRADGWVPWSTTARTLGLL